MFAVFNVLLGFAALTNLIGLAVGKSPTIRQIVDQLLASDDARGRLQLALGFSALAQIYMIGLIFPLKALHHHYGLAWSILMLFSVLETIYTARTMRAAVAGEVAEGQFALHDSRWYVAYQIAFNGAIVWVCVLLVGAAFFPPA